MDAVVACTEDSQDRQLDSGADWDARIIYIKYSLSMIIGRPARILADLLKTYPLAPIALAFWRDLFVAIACLFGFAVLWPGGLGIDSHEARRIAPRTALAKNALRFGRVIDSPGCH